MNTLFQDIRYGFRGLWRNPGFAIIAVLSLALGIGANTAIFSLVNAVLIRSLPFHDPDRLVMVWEDASFAGFPRNTPAPANYADWKSQNQVFEDMAAIATRSFNLTGDGEPVRINTYGVTANFFSLLGVKPAEGRAFNAGEDAPGTKVVVLGYGLWERRYGARRDIIGKDILLNGENFTVIGVAPAGFQFLDKEVELWTPFGLTPRDLANRSSHYLTVFARMKPGVTLQQASADIKTIMQRIARDHPNQAAGVDAYALPLRDELAGDARRPLMVLLAAVGLVLLIACANVANLLLSRAASRGREIAVRAALGAGRLRIARQLLTESVLLSIFGAAVGLVFAVWSFGFLRRLIPEGLALSTSLTIDLRVLTFTLLVTMLTGLIFGLAPALQASKIDLNEALKQGGGRAGLSGGSNRLRGAMVVVEVAMSLVLLVSAGLLIQTFFKMLNQYSGLQPENVLTMRTQLPRGKYGDAPKRNAFYDQVLERVESLPGIVSAGYTTTVPLEWKGGTQGFWVEGRTVEQATSQGLSYDANFRQISIDYLKTMGISLKKGRYFNEGDNERAMPVAVINETMARQYWQGEDALGKRFKLGAPGGPTPWATVVGVVCDLRQMGMDKPVKAEMYFPYRQITTDAWAAPRDLVIRASVDPMSLVAAVRSEVHAVDPDQPLSNIRTMEDLLNEEIGQRRLGMLLLAGFAALALLLASVGIYGVLSYFVIQHTREIGVRLALGARRRHVLGLVMRKGMTLALVGVTIGLFVSFALTRLMASLLYETRAADPLTFAGVATLLMLVATLACYIPAWRAMRVDPMAALRCE
ncbi:MAG: ABC transporter permease [Blastocatellales bacterium]